AAPEVRLAQDAGDGPVRVLLQDHGVRELPEGIEPGEVRIPERQVDVRMRGDVELRVEERLHEVVVERLDPPGAADRMQPHGDAEGDLLTGDLDLLDRARDVPAEGRRELGHLAP